MRASRDAEFHATVLSVGAGRPVGRLPFIFVATVGSPYYGFWVKTADRPTDRPTVTRDATLGNAVVVGGGGV